jgi:hypothetical protein
LIGGYATAIGAGAGTFIGGFGGRFGGGFIVGCIGAGGAIGGTGVGICGGGVCSLAGGVTGREAGSGGSDAVGGTSGTDGDACACCCAFCALACARVRTPRDDDADGVDRILSTSSSLSDSFADTCGLIVDSLRSVKSLGILELALSDRSSMVY